MSAKPRGDRQTPAPEDRVPPHSAVAEAALIGSVLLDPNLLAGLPDVGPGVFYLEKHAAIWAALARVYDTTGTIDLVQVIDRLESEDKIDLIGGTEYLVRLAEQTPSAVNAPHYAGIVLEKHRLRRLIDAGATAMHEALGAGDRPDASAEIADRMAQTAFEVSTRGSDVGVPATLAEALETEMLRMEGGSEAAPGVMTGFSDLDDVLTGLHPGEMIVLAARPSMGKTALALNIAEQIACGCAPGGLPHSPRPVVLYSMEMARDAILHRLISARSGIPSTLIRANRLGTSQYERVLRACRELREVPLVIDDAASLTITTLRARARQAVKQHRAGAIIVDYLQLLTAPGSSRESRQVEVSAISRGVKALARELNVPVVCLSQLNRAAEQRSTNRPRMSDLRESGSIEQDADVILLLHREEYYHQDDPNWKAENGDKAGLAEVIVAKQRNGPTGVVKLVWDAGATRFRSWSGVAIAGPTQYEVGVGEIPV